MITKIKETFQITGRGLVVVLEAPADEIEKALKGKEFIRVDGKEQKFFTEMTGSAVRCLAISIILPGLKKDDVPVGTIVEI